MAEQPVFVVTGPSGAGKGTLIQGLLARMPELEHTISATTRAQRPGEEDGREYWFLSAEEFERRVQAGEFLEHVSYVGGRYGTLRSEIERIGRAGRICILELETEGAQEIKRLVPGSVTVFISAPSLDELDRRLRERATESSDEIESRIELAHRQLAESDRFDHVVVNDEVSRATDELEAIVRRELGAAATLPR